MLTLSLSLVMIAYNEAENVAPCMEEALSFLRGSISDFQLVFVDDGSSDGTAAEARKIQQTDPEHVQIVSYSPNRGMGGALKAGFARCEREWITWLPTDGQIPPEGLLRLIDAQQADPRIDLVTCHFPERFEEADDRLRKLLSRGLRGLMWMATGVSRKLDGIYLVRRETVQGMDLRSDTFFLNLELPIKAIASGLVPGEATMNIRPRRSGESKVVNLRRMRQVFLDLAKLGIELRTGRRIG